MPIRVLPGLQLASSSLRASERLLGKIESIRPVAGNTSWLRIKGRLSMLSTDKPLDLWSQNGFKFARLTSSKRAMALPSYLHVLPAGSSSDAASPPVEFVVVMPKKLWSGKIAVVRKMPGFSKYRILGTALF